MGNANSSRIEVKNVLESTLTTNLNISKSCSPSMMINQGTTVSYDQPDHCPQATKNVNINISGIHDTIDAEMFSKCISSSKIDSTQLSNLEQKLTTAIKNKVQAIGLTVNASMNNTKNINVTKLTQSVSDSIKTKCQPSMSLSQFAGANYKGCVIGDFNADVGDIVNKVSAKGVSKCVMDDQEVAKQTSDIQQQLDSVTDNTQSSLLTLIIIAAGCACAYAFYVGKPILESYVFWAVMCALSFMMGVASIQWRMKSPKSSWAGIYGDLGVLLIIFSLASGVYAVDLFERVDGPQNTLIVPNPNPNLEGLDAKGKTSSYSPPPTAPPAP
jgi:hypothetical protein